MIFNEIKEIGHFRYFWKTFGRKGKPNLKFWTNFEQKMTEIYTYFKNKKSIKYILELPMKYINKNI
jgi:hypothetical protein